MQLKAVPQNLGTILSVNKKYVVPRFQREYSWTDEQVQDFWDDIVGCIKKVGQNIVPHEYFIGPIVLIADDSSNDIQVVDGQQRLITITILLRALCEAFAAEGKKNEADGIYSNYIEGRDVKNSPYFKLDTESPKPFLQKGIQYKEQAKIAPKTDEERALSGAWRFFSARMAAKVIIPDVRVTNKIRALEAIRDQVIQYLKFVYISVPDEEDAYTIFETLNARGLDLSSVDLVKNSLLRDIRTTHPSDDAKEEWSSIKKKITEASSDLETFFRHYWNSKYAHTSEGRIYKGFKRASREGQLGTAKDFLTDLSKEADVYAYIAKPRNQPVNKLPLASKELFSSLDAFNIFNVTQVRPLLLSLFSTDKLSLKQKILTIRAIENFHFIYTAVCSLRASGMDSKYGATARSLRGVMTKADAKVEINSLIGELQLKLPKFEVFSSSFEKLRFTNGFERQKRLIQYFFIRYESFLHGSDELKISDMSLEHISSQSSKGAWVGHIGNLIPLSSKLNNDAGSQALKGKIQVYLKSNFKCVKEFCSGHSNTKDWTEGLAKKRADALAKSAYEKVFALRKLP